jgi:hypothetical protein
MRIILQIISWAALAGTALAPILFLLGRITLDQSKLLLLVMTIVWFGTASLWMGRPKAKVDATPLSMGALSQ